MVRYAAYETMIRLAVVQPSLAKYRTPVFRELASRPRIELTVHYGTTDGIPNVAPEGFNAVEAPIRAMGTARWQQAQVALASRGNCDVMVLGWDLHYASLVPALLRARAQRVGTVLWGHGYSKQENPTRRALREKVGRLADATLFYNRTAADAAIAGGFRRRRVFVALNSLDQGPIQAARAAWAGDKAKRAAFRRDQGLAGPVVLFVSRLDPANRLDLLLHAAKRLENEFPSLAVVIIGNGEHQPELQRLAGELGIANRVRFLGAIYDEASLAPWFCSADVFCYPANIGLSILHAFGYGLPVVTSDRLKAQNPEIEALRNGENGLLYRDGDPAALAEALGRLLRDQLLRSRLSAEALRTVREDFTVPRMVDGMVAAVKFAARRVGGG
jgi:glycosyltransferase involved in cell wall biosynthesis